MHWLFALLGGYAVGSVPFGLLLAMAAGKGDIRQIGSGNIGATNVLRSGSRVAALATLIGDAAKGWVAVLVARYLQLPHEMVALVGFAAFLGHLFPIWLKFKGGKGVATAGAVLIAFDWRLGLAVIVTWLVVAGVSRYSSLASLAAALVGPAAAWFLLGSGPYFYAAIAMSTLVIARHHGNIRKLVSGQESRIGDKKKDAQPR